MELTEEQVEALQLDNSEDVETLFRCSYADDEFVRVAALERLPYIGDERAHKRLPEALGDNETLVMVAALEGLGMFGRPSDLQLISAYLSDEDVLVAEAAEYALGELGQPEAIEILQEHIVPLRGTERVGVEAALYKLGERFRLDSILQQLGDSDDWTRIRAINTLIEVLDDTNADAIRPMAVQAANIETNARNSERLRVLIEQCKEGAGEEGGIPKC